MRSAKRIWTWSSACVVCCAVLAGCCQEVDCKVSVTTVPFGAACNDWQPLHFTNPTPQQSYYASDLTMCADPTNTHVYVSLSVDTAVVWVITAPMDIHTQGTVQEDRLLGPSFRALINWEYADPGMVIEPGASLTIDTSVQDFRVGLGSAEVQAAWTGTLVLGDSLIDMGIKAAANAVTTDSARGRAVNACLVTAFQHALEIARDPDPTAALQRLWSVQTAYGVHSCLSGLKTAFTEPGPIGEAHPVEWNSAVVEEQESTVDEFFKTLLEHLEDVVPKLAR